MLFEALDKLRQQTIISSVIFMVVGLFMLVVPAQYDTVVVYTVGCLLIIFGEVMVWDFIAGDKKLIDSIVLTFALLLILLGIYILVSGNDILKVLSVLFGILLMFDGFHSTVYAWVYARRAGKKWWGVLVVLSLMLIAAGIIIFLNPWWKTSHSFLKVIGGVILFASATGIIRLILVWPIRKS